MSSPTTTTEPQARLTDSAWFWLYVFSTGAFAALMLMQTKYHNRQGHLERVYRYGTHTLSRPAGATLSSGDAPKPDESTASESGARRSGAVAPPAATPAADTSIAVADDSDASAGDDASDQPPFAVGPHPAKQKLLITLEPLRCIAGAAMVVSFIALQWSYFRRRAKAQQ